MRNEQTPIAAEGYPFIAVAGFVTLVFALLAWKIFAVVALALTLFITFFFRNPQRHIPEDEDAVVAPADGVIIYLGPSVAEHLDAELTKISIFMSVFNVHVNRSPIAGRIVDTCYHHGKFLDVRDEQATFENERASMVMESAKGIMIVVVQVAGLIARRIVCYPRKGDSLALGERYGLIRFGSRLDVFLPPNAKVRVAVGDKTVAGETILGYLP